MTQQVTQAIANFALVAEYWSVLAEQTDPSVHAPRPPSLLNPDQRAILDYQSRIERQERDGLMPGEHPDAARPDVLDLLASLAHDAWDIADTVGQALQGPRMARPRHAFTDPTPYLEFVARHLQAAHNGDDMVGPWVARQSWRMVAEMSRALCLAHDGQTLTAHCPWCHGGLTGAPTLRVRTLPGDLVAIVCESDLLCEPPRRKVGTWVFGRPAWPFQQWPWLAKQLHADAERGKMSA